MPFSTLGSWLQENATGSSLLSGAVLDLLGNSKESDGSRNAKDEGGVGLKSMLDGLGALWDEQQYAEEFSLDNFAARM